MGRPVLVVPAVRRGWTPPDLDDRDEAHASCSPAQPSTANPSFLASYRACITCNSARQSFLLMRLSRLALLRETGRHRPADHVGNTRTRLYSELSARWARYYDDGVLTIPSTANV